MSKTKEIRLNLPGQVVLVLQGGGALGAYQAGVYQALHEFGIEPDWVIGTSIGAINAALIAGNNVEDRLAKLQDFWFTVQQKTVATPWLGERVLNSLSQFGIFTQGIPGFFRPNSSAWLGGDANVGTKSASYYSTSELLDTLGRLVNEKALSSNHVRLTVGAVNVASGEMKYFDSRYERVNFQHILASGALPPAFPAVHIEDDWYWDGGIYSNTPIEAVLNDNPRRNSLILSTAVWQKEGDVPQTINQSMGRLKDIQFASRDKHHIEKEQQLHHLRHIIRQLSEGADIDKISDSKLHELASWGCSSVMHVVQLKSPLVPGENQSKDIDFSAAGIQARWLAGYESTKTMLLDEPWRDSYDSMSGILVHEMK